jgi:LysM repeat protein
MRVWWRYHKVASGDTLASIARSYRTTPQAIVRANQLAAKAGLEPDTQLIIPIAPGRHAAAEDAQSYSRHLTVYRVRRGDTVQSVAENFNVSPSMVRRWNRLRSDSLRGRHVLYIRLPVAPNLSPTRRADSSKPKPSNTLRAVSHKT